MEGYFLVIEESKTPTALDIGAPFILVRKNVPGLYNIVLIEDAYGAGYRCPLHFSQRKTHQDLIILCSCGFEMVHTPRLPDFSRTSGGPAEGRLNLQVPSKRPSPGDIFYSARARP